MLKPDAVIERELKGGETHDFQISLLAGQFLHVVVDQRGIDVVVTLFAPDGKQIARTDRPNGDYGPEPVVAIAETPGDYRLTVSAPNKQAGAGRYELKVVALRGATPDDKDHVAAERSFEEAQKLRSQRTAISRRAALEKYQQALRFFQTAGDSYQQALTLNTIGLVYAELSEFRVSLEYLGKALPIWRSLGDKLREAATLNNLGGVNDVLGNSRESLDYYELALSSVKSRGNKSLEAILLNNIGKIHMDRADMQKALEYYSRALPLFRAVGDKRREAIAIHNIGVAHTRLNEFEKALEFYQQAIKFWRAAGNKGDEADTLNNIGFAYALSGETRKALESYNQALIIYRSVGDRRGEGTTLCYIGRTHSLLGEHAKALEQLQQSLLLLRATEDRRFEAIALGAIGQVYTALGQPEKAIEHHAQALAIFRAIGDRQGEASMLQGIARAERDRGNPDEALKQIEAAISLFEQIRARVTSEQLRASYLSSRQDAYQFHIDLLMRMNARDTSAGHDAAALQVSERARARSLLEMLAEASVDIREGADPALLKREQETRRQINAKASRLLQRNTPAQAEELKKEIILLESEYQQIEAAIRKDNPHYAAITIPEPLDVKEIQRQVLDDDTLLLEYSLGDERSYLWAVTNTSVASYELPARDQINKAARQVTELLNARSVRIRTETPQQKIERIAKADAELPEAVRQLSRMVIAPAAAQLGDKRLLIVADGALQYVPFAMLAEPEGWRDGDKENPQSAIRNPQSYAPLVAGHEIITLPSASTLAVMRNELAGRKPAPKALAVIADPVFARDDERFKTRTIKIEDKAAAQTETTADTRIIEHLAESEASATSGRFTIPRLPYTRQEADRILAVAPARANLKALDFKANRATVTSGALGQYRYLHFATHGLLDSERPGLSALVLSLVDEQGRPQDGFLRAHEIYNLKLPADLVVLSACQTGLGKEIKGEGLVGLTRGFMYAGAARVVVSLWNVNDKATSELMAKFYRKMLKEGQRPAAALRSAQVEMWRQQQWQSPYFWAAFVLQGEWK